MKDQVGEVRKWTAAEVKAALYARHLGSGGQMPGPWTCVEEWRGIDLLAFSAWSSASRYARVGYEVKVSRSDLRRELLRPDKRAGNVAWCNEFFFAVPVGLLTDEELEYVEPEWSDDDWIGERCPGLGEGAPCHRMSHRKKTHVVRVPVPHTERYHSSFGWTYIICPTCNGKGVLTASRVEREAPICWVPRDVGLVIVDGRGTRVVRRSPQRRDVPSLDKRELGQLIRFVSMRPDPRHHVHAAHQAVA